MAAQSDALVQVPSRLIQMLQKPLNLLASPIPLKVPPIELSLTWHIKNTNDRELQWLRSLIVKMAKTEA